MSNIKFYTNQTAGTVIMALPYSHKKTLQFYITKLLNRIGETDTEITWYICSEIDLQNIKNPNRSEIIKRIERITGSVLKPLYALTDIRKKEIYISTTAIASAPQIMFNHSSPYIAFCTCQQYFEEQEKQLILVIIDELAHIKSNARHGDSRYEELYAEYAERYFSRNHILRF